MQGEMPKGFALDTTRNNFAMQGPESGKPIWILCGIPRMMPTSYDDGFHEAMLRSPELCACRDDLARIGFSTDLSTHAVLGTGKMLVLQHQAHATLLALYSLSRWNRPLRKSDIVVSTELEHVVRAMARNASIFIQRPQRL